MRLQHAVRVRFERQRKSVGRRHRRGPSCRKKGVTGSAAPSEGEAKMSGTQTAAEKGSASSGGVIAKHPNASVAVGSGSGLGALVVWAVGLGGVVMPAEVGAVIGGGIAGVAL